MEVAVGTSDWASGSRPGERSLAVGERAPRIGALDETGEPAFSNADRIAGHPILLLFCPPGEAAAEVLLGAFRDRGGKFAQQQTTVLALSRLTLEANRASHAALGLPFKLLTDATGEIYQTFGAGEGSVAILLDPNHRIARILRADGPDALAEAVLAAVAADFPPRETRVQAQAPVLLLPRVLEAEDCARLIGLFERPANIWASDGFKSDGHGKETGDFKIRHSGEYGELIEFVLRDPGVERYLDQRFNRSVKPEMHKAFQTVVSQREQYRIARYGSESGGVLRPHRDNSTRETAHRRFTMTINLNAGEYEGGALRFREYGDHFYEVERGTAVVWSASLLHEVMPVTRGARFVLGVHMYGT